MSKVVEITSQEEYDKLLEDHRRLVIFFGAKWCDGCTKVTPLYEQIANRYHKRVTLAHIDIDDNKLDYSQVPVFVAYRKGKQINSFLGGEKHSLKELVKEAILTK